MKVAFDFIADETPLFAAAGEMLKKEGHEVSGLTLGSRWKGLWDGRFQTGPVSTFRIKGDSTDSSANLKRELDRIERDYGDLNPSSFLHADRFLCDFDKDSQLAILVDTFRCVERFFEEEAPNIFFCTPIAYMFNLVTHAVCKRLGTPHISLYTTRGAVPRFTYSTGVMCRWDPVADAYQSHISELQEMDKCEIDKATEDLKRYRSSPHRPYYMKSARINYKFRFVFVKEFLTRLKYYYLDGWGRAKADYMTKSPFWYAQRDLKKFIRASALSRRNKEIFDSIEEGQSYYLFPLHMQPEASTLIYSEWYTDQLSTIENISRCIPFGAYLYVKEHTSAFGRRGKDFYRKVKKLHNVRLLGPWEKTDTLITKSLGVIVLSSTMGWESLMHGKPTYVLGSLFCNDISPSIKVNGYDDLRRRINDEFHCPRVRPMVSDKHVAAFMAAIWLFSYPGLIGPAKLDIRTLVLSDENLSQVVHGLKKIMEDHPAEKVRRDVKKVGL